VIRRGTVVAQSGGTIRVEYFTGTTAEDKAWALVDDQDTLSADWTGEFSGALEWEMVNDDDDNNDDEGAARVTDSGKALAEGASSASLAPAAGKAAAFFGCGATPVASLRVPRGLHVAILVCGTRGDVQPFVLIGQRLQRDGHRVRLATHELYRGYVVESGLEFWPLAGDPRKLSAYMVETGGRLLPLSVEEVKAVPEKQQMLEDIMRSCLPACIANDEASGGGAGHGAWARPFRAQAIISNPPTYGHIHVAEFLDVPLHLMFPQPW